MANVSPETEAAIRRHMINMGYVKLVGAGVEVIGNQPAELPTHCPCCGCENTGDVAVRRLNTAYVKDELNWLLSCHGCYLDGVEHFQDLWYTYYSMVR